MRGAKCRRPKRTIIEFGIRLNGRKEGKQNGKELTTIRMNYMNLGRDKVKVHKRPYILH
jgi:hypothetical protein